MFDFTIPVENAVRLPRPLAASAVAHLLAAALVFTFSTSTVALRQKMGHKTVLLIAPARQLPVIQARIAAPGPREFRIPPVSPAKMPALAVLTAPALESPTPKLPDLPRALPMAPPPLTERAAFPEQQPPASTPAPRPMVRPSGFADLETSAAKPLNTSPPVAGRFASVSAAEGTPLRGTLATAESFPVASSLVRNSSGPRSSIQRGTFADAAVELEGATPKRAAVSRFTPIEILAKPAPAYTDEARREGIEGEVLLEIQFSASGEVHLLRLVRGLGHGLDEAAVAAARGIRFRPAMRDGLAVDSSAVVHIVFQLAN